MNSIQSRLMTFSLSHYSKNQSNSSFWSSEEANDGYEQGSNPRGSTSKKQEYAQFFKDVLPLISQFKIEEISKQSLKHHKVKILDQCDSFFGDMINEGSIYVEPSKIKQNGLESVFDVIIGRFYLVVHVLHIFRNSTEKRDEKKDDKYIGSGTFGTVKLVNIQGKQIALKRLNFPEGRTKPIMIPYLLDPTDLCSPEEIRKAIKEYCIYKICSLLQIGPQVIFTDVYDLVCYNDGIEFQMELCKVVEFNVKRTYAQDLKYCVAKLHASKFAHNDIKPQNTLFSPSLKKYVLSDFGLSQSVKQSVGQKTETYFKGTMKYASSQMRSLHPNKSGFVDLFYHDMHSLKVCIQQCEQYISNESESSSSSSGQQSDSSCKNSISAFERQQSGTLRESHDESYPASEESVGEGEHTSKTTQSSSSYQPSILSQQFILNSVEINYYIMKTLYGLFQEDETNEVYNPGNANREKLEKLIERTARRVCGEGETSQLLDIVIKMVNLMLVSADQKVNNVITLTRSILRIYGFFSDQFIAKLTDIIKSKSLPSLNIKQLEGRIRYLDKFTQNYSTHKFEKVCSNLKKHEKLRNQKPYLDCINYILKCKLCTENLNSDIKSDIMKGCLRFIKQISATDIPTIYAIFKCQNIVNQIKPEQQSKLAKNQKYRLVEYLYKVAKHGTYSCATGGLFFTAYIELGAQQVAFTTILNEMIKMYQQIRVQRGDFSSQTSKQTQIFLNQINVLILCLAKRNPVQSFQFIEQNIDAIKKAPLCQEKISFLLVSARALAQSGQDIAAAQELNQLSYELRKQYYFPVVDFGSMADYFFLKGVIAKKRGQLSQALEYLYTSVTALSDQLRVGFQFGIRERVYSWLYLTYEELGDYENALKYFEHMICLNFENSFCEMHKKIRFLGNFIRYKIKLNHTADLYNLFDLYFQFKMSLANNSDKSVYDTHAFRNIPAFFLADEQASPLIKRQTILSAKMALVQVLSKYLPIFLVQYRKECEWIAEFYMKQLHMKSKALPYLWNYFRKFPYYEITENDTFTQKLYVFATMLSESNSNRIALKFLQKYAYRISNQSGRLTQLIFKKLYNLSRDLGHKKFKLYSLIWRYRPYQSKMHYQICIEEMHKISELEMKIPVKRAIIKKIFSFDTIFRNQSSKNAQIDSQFDLGRQRDMRGHQDEKKYRLIKKMNQI